MNNMKMMTAEEMEMVNGGYEPRIAPMEITRLELTSLRNGLLGQEDLLAEILRRRPGRPEMIDPEILKDITEELIRKTERRE